MIDYLPLFSSPLWVMRIEDEAANRLNVALAEQLVAESQREAGIQRSNVGGWHSLPDLSSRKTPLFERLMGLLVDGAQTGLEELVQRSGANVWPEYRLGLEAWAMVMRNGDYTIPHDHAEAHFSGVYYLDAGDADLKKHPDSGLLAFQDPRGGRLCQIPGLDLYSPTFTVEARTGVLVMFPGFLSHYVHPYQGTRPRVCVSFNLRIELVNPLQRGD